MSKNRIFNLGTLGLFGLGFAAGIAAHKFWPLIQAKMGPIAKNTLAKGLELVDQTKEAFWEKSEKISDLIAEVQEEEEAKAKEKVKPRTKASTPKHEA